MLGSTWGLALTVVGVIVLCALAVAARTAVRVLRYWDQESDSALQIGLENETWLASTLVTMGLWLEIFSLILVVMAADEFSGVLTGAMCAVGAFKANAFGLPLLVTKIISVFCCGGWLSLHRLDISSPAYPLARLKYFFLLCLLPLVGADILLQTLYVAWISPDVITSCCSLLFDSAGMADKNLFFLDDPDGLLRVFLLLSAMLFVLMLVCRARRTTGAAVLTAILWALYFPLALYSVTTVISPYIYAMPFHHCPFCILKAEYHFIGYGIYFFLFLAAFFGLVPAVFAVLRQTPGLRETADRRLRSACGLSLIFLVLFLILSFVHPLLYHFFGGEW